MVVLKNVILRKLRAALGNTVRLTLDDNKTVAGVLILVGMEYGTHGRFYVVLECDDKDRFDKYYTIGLVYIADVQMQ